MESTCYLNNPTALESHLAVSNDLDLPLWLGEFGEAAVAQQEGTISLVEDQGIGWALWPWKRIQMWEKKSCPL